MQHVLRTQLFKTSKIDMFQHSSFVVSFYFFLRTTFSFLSGILTLVVAWAIFGQDNSEHLTAENAADFTVIINSMDISD